MTTQDTGERTEGQPPKRPLFRPEAVEHHARARLTTTNVLDLRERRTTWLFRGLLVAMVVAVLLAFVIHVDRSVSAQGMVGPSGTLEFALPQRFEDSVREGQQIQVRADGRDFTGRVTGWRNLGNGAIVVAAEAPDVPRGEQVRVVLDLDRRSVAEQLMGRS